jgi:hypothetical protein
MCVTARDIFPGVVKKNLSISSWSGLVEENTESRSDERVQKMELTLVNGYTISFQLAFQLLTVFHCKVRTPTRVRT